MSRKMSNKIGRVDVESVVVEEEEQSLSGNENTPHDNTAKVYGDYSEINPKEFLGKSINNAFQTNYRKTNLCGRLFFTYATPLINAIRGNNYKMDQSMIEDM